MELAPSPSFDLLVWLCWEKLAPSQLDYFSILKKYFCAWLLICEQLRVPMCLSIFLQSFLNSSMPSKKRRCSSSVQRPCKLLDLEGFLGIVVTVFCRLIPSEVEPKRLLAEFSFVSSDWCLLSEGGSLETDKIFYWDSPWIFERTPVLTAVAPIFSISSEIKSLFARASLTIDGSPSLVSLMGN